MDYLSRNDFRRIAAALSRSDPLVISRTLGAVEVVAQVASAAAGWEADMIVGVSVSTNGRVCERQWFESAEKAEAAVRRWKY